MVRDLRAFDLLALRLDGSTHLPRILSPQVLRWTEGGAGGAVVRTPKEVWRDCSESQVWHTGIDDEINPPKFKYPSDSIRAYRAEILQDTIEKAKDVVRAYADCYQPTEKMLAALDALLQEET